MTTINSPAEDGWRSWHRSYSSSLLATKSVVCYISAQVTLGDGYRIMKTTAPVASSLTRSKQHACQKAFPAAVCWPWVVALTCSTISLAGSHQAQTAATASGNDANYSASAYYVELELQKRVNVSALKPGDVVDGRLSRDIYSGDRELFPAGSPVHLTVAKLERRKREPNDHWPGVITLFTPRHENYPTMESATVSLPGGREVPLRVSLISIMNKSELHPPSKTRHSGANPNIANQKQKGSTRGQTVILEATGLTPEMISTLAPTQPASGTAIQTGPVKLDTGTRAQVVLLRSLSASKNRRGDSFLARVVEPVRLGSRIVLPEGSLLEGTVLKATPPRWLSRPGSLNLTFTGLRTPQGESGPITARLAGAEVDSRSQTRLDSEGGLKGGPPGKAWMLINLGVTAGIAKVTDDSLQLVIEAIVSTATDASTAGVTRIVAACTSGIFMVTRHGRDVVLPRFTEMDISFNRPFVVPEGNGPTGAKPATDGGGAPNAAPLK